MAQILSSGTLSTAVWGVDKGSDNFGCGTIAIQNQDISVEGEDAELRDADGNVAYNHKRNRTVTFTGVFVPSSFAAWPTVGQVIACAGHSRTEANGNFQVQSIGDKQSNGAYEETTVTAKRWIDGRFP